MTNYQPDFLKDCSNGGEGIIQANEHKTCTITNLPIVPPEKINSSTDSTHNVERLPSKIAIKYNLPLPIAKEVAHHVIADRRSVIDHEPVLDTVFIYRKKE